VEGQGKNHLANNRTRASGRNRRHAASESCYTSKQISRAWLALCGLFERTCCFGSLRTPGNGLFRNALWEGFMVRGLAWPPS